MFTNPLANLFERQVQHHNKMNGIEDKSDPEYLLEVEAKQLAAMKEEFAALEGADKTSMRERGQALTGGLTVSTASVGSTATTTGATGGGGGGGGGAA